MVPSAPAPDVLVKDCAVSFAEVRLEQPAPSRRSQSALPVRPNQSSHPRFMVDTASDLQGESDGSDDDGSFRRGVRSSSLSRSRGVDGSEGDSFSRLPMGALMIGDSRPSPLNGRSREDSIVVEDSDSPRTPPPSFLRRKLPATGNPSSRQLEVLS